MANPFDFSAAIELDISVEFIPKVENSVFSLFINFPLFHYPKVSFSLLDYEFETEDQVCFRTYPKDSDHAIRTEIPKVESSFYLQSYFSVILQ